ncbi:hypothetical protein EC988_002123 [Linderina pennispora]|nr:hypothetical protein EC988_002123 [Linderina pennispora]
MLYTVVYALYLSPLRHIPGPLLARITPLHDKVLRLLGLRTEVCERNFRKYGDIYVISPTSVSISNPHDCSTVLATHRFTKSAEYDKMVISHPTTFSTRDPQMNKMRRHQIGPAFNPSYLREMEPQILEHGILALKQKWDSQLDRAVGHDIEVVYSVDFLLATFDVIGLLGYGQSFHALKNNDTRVVRWARSTVKLALYMAVFPPIRTWPFCGLISEQLSYMNECTRFGQETIRARKSAASHSNDDRPRDVLQSFIDSEDPGSKTRMTADQVEAEVRMLLLAATDTTALTLTWTLHLLLLHPDAYRRAVSEIRSQFAYDEVIRSSGARAKLPFTEACIYEAMRLRPVSGQNFTRDVPSGGVQLQGHHIPAGFTVGVNFAGHCLHPTLWDSPERFLPERFLDNPKAKQTLITFSAGARACPGKALAWMEMLTLLPNILKDYDLCLPKGALFTPDNIDPTTGDPAIMPRTHSVTAQPKYPDRDCRVLVSKCSSY